MFIELTQEQEQALKDLGYSGFTGEEETDGVNLLWWLFRQMEWLKRTHAEAFMNRGEAKDKYLTEQYRRICDMYDIIDALYQNM